MLLTFAKTTFGAAFVLAATASGFTGDPIPQSLPLTPIVFAPDGRLLAQDNKTPYLVPVAGAECPTSSGNYCSDELPYCCPGVSVDPYCAKDVNGCTQ